VKHVRVHWRIYGGVQGVGFREFARRAAEREGLAGFARNCADGSVQVEAEGPPDAVERLRRTLRTGPPHATVWEVRQETPGEAALPPRFTVRY
jgi:acylphosphatase